MKRILVRASKTPFENLYDGPIPEAAYGRVWRAQRSGGLRNAGNLVFGHAAYKVLSAPGVELDIDHYRLSLNDSFAAQADRINERYDAFVLPMANSFRPAYRDTLARMTRTIVKLRIPCIVTGIGAQLSLGGSYGELESIESEVKAFVSAILDRSAAIGVRGEVTRGYLRHLGFPDDAIEVIGCPSMFYHGGRMAIAKRPIESIAVNLTPMDNPKILRFTTWFNDRPDNVTFVDQDIKVMREASEGRYPRPDSPPTVAHPAPRLEQPGKIACVRDLMPWMDLLAQHSFAIGTKIHGNIVALLAGTPSHVIAHDSRTLELVRYFEIPHTPLAELGDFDFRETVEKSDYGALNGNHPARLATYARFLERNGLAHILYDDSALAGFDGRVRESLAHARLPRPPGLTRRALHWAVRSARRTLGRGRRQAAAARKSS